MTYCKPTMITDLQKKGAPLLNDTLLKKTRTVHETAAKTLRDKIVNIQRDTRTRRHSDI